MEIVLMVILLVLALSHIGLCARQILFISRLSKGPSAEYAKARTYAVCFSFLLDIAWCGLVAFSPSFTTAHEIAALILARLLARGLILRAVQMVMEKHFGFGRTSVLLFIKDSLKTFALQTCIVFALSFFIFLNIPENGTHAVLLVWGVWFAFDWGLMALRPWVNSKLFYQESPLCDSELQHRIDNLKNRVGLSTLKLVVLDGSKRSSHTNARMEGIGPFKRVVVLDTLLDLLNPAEIESVIAHELGHQQHAHIVKYQCLKGGLSLLAVLGFAQFSQSISALVICAPALSALALPILNCFIRSCEYQADAFVARLSDADRFIQALDKLHGQNNSMETNDPLYSAVYHGHPMAHERKEKLRNLINGPSEMHLA